MSINITNLGGVVNYHDNHKEVTIHSTGNVSDIVRQFMNEDIELLEDLACSEKDQAGTSKSSPNKTAKNDDILPIPKKGKYTEVRKYIEERCKFDNDFKTYVERNSRVELCIYLTDLFGWDVDPHHLGVNMNRNR